VGITVIELARGWVPLKLRELSEYREVLHFLIRRDVKVGYRQTPIGAAWAIIQPFVTMVVFAVFFGRVAKMPSDAGAACTSAQTAATTTDEKALR
jgi:homopolymeric O-antigen transport system permease protein